MRATADRDAIGASTEAVRLVDRFCIATLRDIACQWWNESILCEYILKYVVQRRCRRMVQIGFQWGRFEEVSQGLTHFVGEAHERPADKAVLSLCGSQPV